MLDVKKCEEARSDEGEIRRSTGVWKGHTAEKQRKRVSRVTHGQGARRVNRLHGQTLTTRKRVQRDTRLKNTAV